MLAGVEHHAGLEAIGLVMDTLGGVEVATKLLVTDDAASITDGCQEIWIVRLAETLGQWKLKSKEPNKMFGLKPWMQ